MSIRLLSPNVAAKIAAGEVVERPASIVKELLENSLDAGATRISVEVAQGGLSLIRVSDDGCGLPAGELALAFERHATSKLATADDLDAIATLGFRGEALPSIAAVAVVELVSCPADALTGEFVQFVDGQIEGRGSRGVARGTTVTVRGLFGRQPARRKFLRTPEAEARQIAVVVSHYALAYPEVSFSLRVDNRQSLSTGGGPLSGAVAAVYGAEVAAAVLPIDAAGDIAIHGLVAPPSLSRASRNYVSIFVNRRWVQNRRLAYAVGEAYHGMLTVDRHPIAIVNVMLPPGEVDVNVHPTKAEVRFRKESDVFAAIQRSVRQALLQQAPVPSLAYSGVSFGAFSGTVWPRTAPVPPLSPMWRGPGLSAATNESSLAQTASAPLPRLTLPVLRVVGQIDNTYVVAEGPDGMYLIDQHAAHERVLFEEIAGRSIADDAQGLLTPTPIELTAAQEELLRVCGDALGEQGFLLEPFGPRVHLIRSVPTYLQGDPRDALLAFLDRLGSEEGVDSAERVAKSLSCHAAVRAGKTLSLDEMRELVRRLEASQVPHTCPHGRPTMIHMSTMSLEREFHRR